MYGRLCGLGRERARVGEEGPYVAESGGVCGGEGGVFVWC